MRAEPAVETGLLTPERLLELRRPVDVEVSADGSRVAFTVSPSYRPQGEGFETRLWLDGEPLTAPGAADAVPRLSADGSQLAYASDRGHAGRMSLWLHGRGELGDIAGSVEDIRWSPDAARLLVLAADVGSDRAGAQSATKIKEAGAEEEDPKVIRPAQHWRRLYLVEVASGETREVSPEGVNVFEFAWDGDETLWYAGSRRAGSHFGRLAVGGGYEELYAGDAVVGVRFQQRIAVGGGRVVAAFESVTEPPEVVDFVNGEAQALTSLNEDLAAVADVADWSDYTWESFDGLEIQGLLCLPRERGDGPLPLVVYVHGGPTGTWTWQFPY